LTKRRNIGKTGAFKSEKRKKELTRQKKQERKGRGVWGRTRYQEISQRRMFQQKKLQQKKR